MQVNHCKGFTLIELIVATAAASIISLAALTLYVQYHEMVLHLQKSYQEESASLIRQMQQAMPYAKQDKF